LHTDTERKREGEVREGEEVSDRKRARRKIQRWKRASVV
jgi:hypothetical protein